MQYYKYPCGNSLPQPQQGSNRHGDKCRLDKAGIVDQNKYIRGCQHGQRYYSLKLKSLITLIFVPYFQKRSFSTFRSMSFRLSVRLSVRTRQMALFVNLSRLELTYRAQFFRDYSFSDYLSCKQRSNSIIKEVSYLLQTKQLYNHYQNVSMSILSITVLGFLIY